MSISEAIREYRLCVRIAAERQANGYIEEYKRWNCKAQSIKRAYNL